MKVFLKVACFVFCSIFAFTLFSSELDYIRGFLITKEPDIKLESEFFKKIDLPDESVLYCHKHLEYAYVKDNENFVVLMGSAINISTGSYMEETANELLAALKVSEEEFFDTIDFLAGRYVVIYSKAGEVKILNDAIGLKAVFYSVNLNIASSHSKLIADLIGSGKSPVQEAKDNGALTISHGYPGLTTPYKDILRLSPNTFLDFYNLTTQRYFPRGPVTRLTVEEAAFILKKSVQIQAKTLINNGKTLAIALSAGQDSRVALAAIIDDWSFFENNKNKLRFYTGYKNTQVFRVDLTIACYLAKKLGLNHCYLHMGHYKSADDIELLNRAIENSLHYTCPDAMSLLRFLFGFNECVHFGPHLLETAGCFWRGSFFSRYHKDKVVLDPVEMATLYNIYSRAPGFRQSDYPPEILIKEYENFCDIAQFNESTTYNYDQLDLFYWEHRMGSWYSEIISEYDLAMPIHSWTSCRHCLNASLSLSLDDRFNQLLFKRIVSDFLVDRPEIKDVEINPRLDKIPDHIKDYVSLDFNDLPSHSNRK